MRDLRYQPFGLWGSSLEILAGIVVMRSAHIDREYLSLAGMIGHWLVGVVLTIVGVVGVLHWIARLSGPRTQE